MGHPAGAVPEWNVGSGTVDARRSDVDASVGLDTRAQLKEQHHVPLQYTSADIEDDLRAYVKSPDFSAEFDEGDGLKPVVGPKEKVESGKC